MATHEELVLEAILKIRAEGEEQLAKINQQFRETADETTPKLNTAMLGLAGAAVAATAAVAVLGATFARSLGDLLEYTEGLEKANLATGLSVEFWQKLIKTGAEMGISFDSMRGAVERLEKTIAGNGEALRKFGIDVENFKGLKPDEVLRAFAVQVMAIEDPLVRAAAAMAGTGRSGAEMVPIFAAIVSGAVDAQRVLGTDTVDSLYRVNNALSGAKTAWNSLKQELTAFVAMRLPLESTLNNFATGLNAIGRIAAQWPGWMEAMRKGTVVTFADMVTAAGKAEAAEASHAARIGGTSKAVLELTETERQLRVGLDQLVAIWEKEEKANEKARVAANKYNEQQRKWATEQLSKETEMIRKNYEAEEKEQQKHQAWVAQQNSKEAEQFRKNIEAETAEDQKKWRRMAQAATEYYRQDSISAAANFFKTRTELQQTAAEAEASYRRMLAAGTATFEQLRAAHQAWKQAEADLNAKSTVTAIEGFQMVADSASTILRSLFGKSKAAAIAAAIIDTLASIVKTLAAYPWPWSLIPAAAAAAVGYANVDKIRSQEAGFAQGTPGTSFQDFGPISYRPLHGVEAIITRAQGESVASMVRDGMVEGFRRLGGQTGSGAGRDVVVNVRFVADGRDLGEVVSRRVRAGLLPGIQRG